jgi:DNA-binding NtrC family response regulator
VNAAAYSAFAMVLDLAPIRIVDPDEGQEGAGSTYNAAMRDKVLIVDDEPAVRRPVRRYLESQGFEVCEAGTVQMGAAAVRAERPDGVVLDFELPDGTALDLLPELKRVDPELPVVLLTGHGSIERAVQCIKEGAENFLTKPADLPALATMLQRALEHRRTGRRDRAARRVAPATDGFDPFAGSSRAIRALAEEASLAVESEAPVLIQGETGSGKGVLARWLHERGSRADEAFVKLNCAGLSRELLESEIFGHARGAFTGAVSAKKGLMEVAHRGTFFLDEIGDMDLQVQPKLLTALEEKRFRRLGEVEEIGADARFVTATHHDLARLVQEGEFRSDLYFRINTIVLRVPPLRERPGDIPVLAEAILSGLIRDMARGPRELDDGALEALGRYGWPGNIRELRNVLERALLVSRRSAVGASDLRFEPDLQAAGPFAAGGGGLDFAPPDATLAEMEKSYIETVLRAEKGQVQSTAERLDVPRSTLYQKLKVFDIDPARYRG